MARSPGAGKRRKLLRSLREAKNTVNLLCGWWDVRGTVFIPSAERAPGDNAYQRERLAHEYPEVQSKYWGATYVQLDKLINELTVLRAQASDEYFAALADEKAAQAERVNA